ncbi:MAG: peptidase Ste24p [Nocardioides sp.]|uniref:M48 family metallopeptidase n=1 Tax=Nocardioides sp. TaxID=35761 RepID=UPI0026050B28|nr:M48 family metallopeptidase [Nocardioides sp.]MCW2834012.1 peptidase Ste24p [Nocardioides sp.]
MTDKQAVRRVALVVTAIATVGFAIVALVWVPWQPVAGGAPPAVAPESVFTPLEVRRGEDYASWARLWSLSSLAISLAVASALGFSRWGARVMARLPGPWWVQVVLGVALIGLAGRLATLPCSVMLQRHRLAGGLSNQPWADYARDLVVGEAIAAMGTSLVLLALIGVARRWARAWPAMAAFVVGALVVLTSFVYPVVVEPLNNDFVPLEQGELRSAILTLADQEEVHVDNVLVADASRRTTSLNAYVSGFGATRRVVVYDTLVESLSQDEALSVVAHELAHAAHDDVVIGTSLAALGCAAGVGLLGLVLTRRGRGPSMADPGVVPLVLALALWATLVASPLQNGTSRQIETRADVDALTATGESAAFVEMQRTLALRSLADPTPPAWLHWWWGSHPTTLERVAIARSLSGQK